MRLLSFTPLIVIFAFSWVPGLSELQRQTRNDNLQVEIVELERRAVEEKDMEKMLELAAKADNLKTLLDKTP